jgi:hypothetical protein
MCDEKGHKRTRAYYLYREKFHEKSQWDWQYSVKPVPPNVEQRNFVISIAIAYMKAKKYG